MAAPVAMVPTACSAVERPHNVSRRPPAEVKDGDHGHHQRVAHAGAKLVPMGGDKQDHAAGQQDGAENQSDYSLPAQPGLGLGCASGCSVLVDS